MASFDINFGSSFTVEITQNQTIQPGGIASLESFGTLAIIEPITLLPSSIISGEQFGGMFVQQGLALNFTITLIFSP